MAISFTNIISLIIISLSTTRGMYFQPTFDLVFQVIYNLPVRIRFIQNGSCFVLKIFISQLFYIELFVSRNCNFIQKNSFVLIFRKTMNQK
jgi:hypothetical protein